MANPSAVPSPETMLPVPAAILHLEIAEREIERRIVDDAARLEKTRQVLAQLRELAGLAGTPQGAGAEEAKARPARSRQTPAPQRRVTESAAIAEGLVDETKVRAFLGRGPVKPAAFAKHFKLTPFLSRRAVSLLEARGVVVVTGATINKRIALADGEPASEGD